MLIKGIITAAAVTALCAGAAVAQDIPSSSPRSDYTVNPPADSTVRVVPAPNSVTLTPNSESVIIIDGEARVPVSAEVAARSGIVVEVITNGPVPDTPENRAEYGGPMSRAGQMTTPAGN
jgi:hypothetical protein